MGAEVSPRHLAQLTTTSLEVVVQATPSAVYAAVRDIAGSLWHVGESDVVTVTAPTSLVHSVRLDGDVSCWLTWEITAIDGGSSEVRLVHDEADLRVGPAPELGEVIAALNTRLREQRSIVPSSPSGEATP